jgi:hypothetical protein
VKVLRAAVVMVLATVAACSGDASSGEPSVPSGPTGVMERDGVVVTLALERDPLPSGSSSRARVTVINTSTAPRRWQGGGCDLPATIEILTAAEVTPAEGRQWPGTAGQFKSLLRPNPGPSRVGTYLDERFAQPANSIVLCPANLGVNTLEPGQRVAMTGVWDGQVNGVAAVGGAATVRATFPYLGSAAGPGPNIDPSDLSHAIVVALSVDIAPPARPLLSPGEAIDGALANAEFAAWLTAAGPMAAWEGVDMEGRDGISVVILYVHGQAGRATVDRATGAVSFEVTPRG